MSHGVRQYFQNDLEIIELKNDAVAAEIAVNIGNTLFSFKKGASEKIYFPYSLEDYKANSTLAGNPFMHPWANRLEAEYILLDNDRYGFPHQLHHLLYRDGNNLPLHGLLLKSEKWKTLKTYEDEHSAYHIAEFVFDHADLLSIFPFRHRIQVKHVLQGNKLTIETSIQNEDEKELPVSFGYHPYFIKDKDVVKLTIPADEVLEVDEKMIPTGKYFTKTEKWSFTDDEINLEKQAFDDGFQNLKFENGAAAFQLNDMSIIFDKQYPFAQIYAPSNPNKPYVCIEPMTAATNALNKNACKKIKQGEIFSARFSIVL